MKVEGDYLGEEIPICLSMGTWLSHIARFKRQYDKAFVRDPIFGADLMDRIQKRVRVFLHSCNTTAIEDVESGALAEFGELQKKVERGECLNSTPVWVRKRRRDAGNMTDTVWEQGQSAGEVEETQY